MAKQNIPIFAVGLYKDVQPAVESGVLTYPSYVFCTDTNTMAFVDKNLEIHNFEGYNQESIIYVDVLPESDIRKDAFYICEGIGYLYIDSVFVPIFNDSGEINSYDDLYDIPIINKYGDIGEAINLSELDNGCYSVTGSYQICDGDTTYITSRKILFLVDSDVENKYITKFGTGEILLYTVNLETGEMTQTRYATEEWIEEKGYADKTYIDEAIRDLYDKIIEEIPTKMSELENDTGYLTENDLVKISEEEIRGLF